MQEQHTILQVSNLRITFEGTRPFTAVNNISFHVNKGKTLAIVGESGSGKSLTALALMGLLPMGARVQGTMRLTSAGQPIHIPGSDSDGAPLARGEDVSMVFQDSSSALNPVISVGRQVQEAILAYQNISPSAAKQLAINWLEKVQLPEPGKIYDRYPHQLSGGQKQRVMIAMAMCNHPALLIADEPTTALDVTVQHEIIRLMTYLQQTYHMGMIFITHDLSLAASIADEIAVMYKGELAEYGAVAQIIDNPRHPYTRALLACRPSFAHKGQRLPVVQDMIEADSDAPVHEVHESNIIVPEPSSAPLLTVNNLKVWFAGRKSILSRHTAYQKAVDDVSFALNNGEVLGLVGESGSGKSTICRALMGLLPVNGGEILFGGQDLARLPTREWGSVRRQVQMIFQDSYSSLNPRMTIGDILAEPLLVHRIVPRAELQKEIKKLLDMVHLPIDALQRYPHQFSGGQRQRIGIARALAMRPRLLICDEIVSSLDVSIQAQVLNLLKDLQQELKLTYLFVSHDLSVVHYISDRVMVLHNGRIVETGSAADVLQNPQQPYTQSLVAAMPQTGKLN